MSDRTARRRRIRDIFSFYTHVQYCTYYVGGEFGCHESNGVGSMTAALAFGLFMAGGLFVAGYLYAGDFERYSILTVGVFERIAHEPQALDGAECREHWCETAAGDGEHRRWFKEVVVGGVPVASYGGGSGYYCGDHAHVSIQRGEFDETRSVSDSVVWALVWVAETFATPTETPDDSAFESVQEDVTAGMGSAIQLVPVALLVVVASLVIRTVGAASLNGVES